MAATRWIVPAALLAGLGAVPLGATSTGSRLEIEVGNVRSAVGRVHVDICTREQFLKKCLWSGSAPAEAGTTRVVIRNLPPGSYAAQAFQDENGNSEVDQGLFGIPKEGIGFSNDARIRLGPPKYRDAEFHYAGGDERIRLNLRYFR